MTYQEWLNKINELLKSSHKYQVRNKLTYKAYRSGQSPEVYANNING